MKPQWRGWLDQARQEWARNPRLQLGVWVIAATLGLYLLLVLHDWRQALQQRHVERSEYLQKMRSLVGQDEWVERAEQAAQIRRSLEAEIPGADSLGLAQAGVQTWVRDMATAAGGTIQVQTQPPRPVPGRDDLWRVPVVLSGALDARSVVQMISQIEKRGSLTVVEQALILNRENRTFSLTVVAYFDIEQEQADAAR